MTYPFRLFLFPCLILCGTQGGCGDGLFPSSYGPASHNSGTDWDTTSPIEKGGSKEKVALLGSVVSAFQLTVDGRVYQDSEDFYSQEILRLQDKVAEAGYSGWDARFEAVLGFNDLASGMTVYAAPTAKTGYSGQAAVASDGKFRIEFPSNARDESVNVRAVKRVNVVLLRGGEVRKFCYNFSAVEKNVSLKESSLPVLLDSFQTQMTLYSCDSQPSRDGLALPSNNGQVLAGLGGVGTNGGGRSALVSYQSAVVDRVGLGESSESVVKKFGDPYSITRESSWSRYGVPQYDKVWKYVNFPGNTNSFNCLLYFRQQSLVAFDDCPAMRINFAESSQNAPAKPTSRVAAWSYQATVLENWGMPKLVSVSLDGREATWDYADSQVTTRNNMCSLKFVSGLLKDYSGVCQLSWLAHWTF